MEKKTPLWQDLSLELRLCLCYRKKWNVLKLSECQGVRGNALLLTLLSLLGVCCRLCEFESVFGGI